MIWLVLVAGAILLLGGSLLTQSGEAASSADLGNPLSDFAKAIGYSGEGFGKPGARPTRNNNPGDMILAPPASNYTNRSDGTYAIFDTAQDGWQALEDEMDLIRRGVSKHYNTSMSFEQMAKVYSPDGWQNWANNVAKALGASPADSIGGYL